MTLARWLGAAVALAMTVPGASAGGGGFECGGVAPFQNSCEAGPFAWDGAAITLGVFGFVGTLEVRLEQHDRALVYRCEALGLAPLTDCDTDRADLVPGEPTFLRCLAKPHPLGFPAVGSWACRIES